MLCVLPPTDNPRHRTPATGRAQAQDSRCPVAPAGSGCDFSSGTDSFCNGLWETFGGNFRWRRKTGSTSSLLTGPSAGPFGGSYVYLEASAPNYPDKTAYLTSALGWYSGITFKYHMHGETMGSLGVQVKRSGVWDQEWSRTGEQHNWYTAPWTTAQVTFTGPVDQVRFVGVTGRGFESDAAVADVLLVPGCVSSQIPGMAHATAQCWLGDCRYGSPPPPPPAPPPSSTGCPI